MQYGGHQTSNQCVRERKRKIHIGRAITPNPSSSLLMTQKIVLYLWGNWSVRRVNKLTARCVKRVLPSRAQKQGNYFSIPQREQNRESPAVPIFTKLFLLHSHHIVRTSAIFGALICSAREVLHGCATEWENCYAVWCARSINRDRWPTNHATLNNLQLGKKRGSRI